MRFRRALRISAGVAALAVLTLTTTDASAVTLGQLTAAPGLGGRCPGGLDLAQTGISSGNTYTATTAGALTSFTTQAYDPAGSDSIALIAVRHVTGSTYTIVGRSAAHALPTALPGTPAVTAITPLPVQAGDIIGLTFTGTSEAQCARYAVATTTADVLGAAYTTAVGASAPFFPNPNFRLSLTANLRQLTTLTAAPATSPSYLLSATLRDSAGTGIAGQTINFSTSAGPVCSAVTNASGVASCSVGPYDKVSIGAINTGGYNASFAGNPADYFPATAHGNFGSPTPTK